MSGGNTLAVSMSLVAGVAGTVQIAVMVRLGERIGVIPAFAFAAAVAAGFGVLALLTARRSFAGYAHAVHQPSWLWLGGAVVGIGALIAALPAPRRRAVRMAVAEVAVSAK